MTDEARRDDLELAHHLADVAAGIALRHFAPSVPWEGKADGSPVTAADLEVDAALVSILRDRRPGDAILSEEGGTIGLARRRWIIDPIDGTVPFAAGGSGWGTFIALEEDGELVSGVVNHPVDRRRYWADRAGGAHAAATQDGVVVGASRRVRVSATARLEDVRFTAVPPVPTPALEALRAVATWVDPTYDFWVDLVEGRLDVLLSQGGGVWDHAAQVVILEAAGGVFHDPHGGRRLDLRGGTYTNGGVAGEVGALLGRF